MTAALLLALASAASAAAGPSASVLLRPLAPATPACRAAPAEGGLLRAGLFAPESAACPVAKVGDEVIPLRELAAVLEVGHLARSPRARAPQRPPEMDFRPALDRLVQARLLVQEAREMQLDQAPEFKAQLASWRASRLRALLQREVGQRAEADPALVERLYREAVREWKLRSVMVEKPEDARAFASALAGGEEFEALARRFIAEKRARGAPQAEWAPRRHMRPEIVEAARAAKPGVPVGPLQVAGGQAWIRVDGTRVPPKDAEARAEAKARARAKAEHEAIRKLYLDLQRRDARVDDALLEQLDFEAGGEPAFAALARDARPLATIRGDAPVTVADVAKELQDKFFHGMASPIKERRVNAHKRDALEKVLGERLFAREIAARRIAERPAFLREADQRERSLAFDTLVERVIAPDVKVTEDEGLRAYEARKAELTAPELVRLEGVAFPSAAEAQEALASLRAGTDLAWLRANAPGQVPAARRTLAVEGRPLVLSALPPGLPPILAGAKPGEDRLFTAREGEVWVLRLVERTPARPQPYAEVREEILKRLVAEKLVTAIRDYADKLRKVQRVEVLVTRVSP